MKKHLLLILALLAFVLPARAQSDPDMLYNFKNNSTDSDYGTNFNTSVDIDNVIDNVTGVYVTDGGANAKNYVSAITEATNVAYNSKGGVYMKAGGKLTFTLKKGYKVTGYQFMGQQLNGTTATITLNGISFDGPTDTQADGQFSRLYPVPSSVTTVNSITISSNKDVYIKSVGIYIEAEDTPTPEKCATPVFSPASGTFGAGKEITVTCSTPGATISVSDGNDFDINLTSGQTFKLPTAKGEYSYIAEATATGYEASEIADASYTVQWPTCEKPVFNPNGGTVAPGMVVTLTCATAGAEITYYPADNEDDFNLVESGHTFTLPTTPGTYTYKAFADASATFYGQSEIVTATYNVTAPVHNEVAPKISFSPEDQKVFGSEEEIDVTLNLNHDVYPVPNVIYYTLDGFMAHNTLETGTPGATPAGHVHTVTVNPSTLSGTVRIERSHREALNHRAVTINAYAVNTAGSDVAAATYIFNDNAAPLPDPEPTTITATVTMANQGWTSGPYSASSKNATWTSDEIVALDNATLSFETSVTISVNSNYPRYYTKTPAGLRIYGTSYNKITIKAPTGYVFKSVKPTFEEKDSPKFYLGDFSDETNRVEMTSGQEYTLTNSASSIMLSANAGQIGLGSVVFVLEKTAAKAAVAPVSIKTADATTFELVTDPTSIVAGDEIIIATYYKSTAKNNTGDFYAYLNSTTSNTYGAITKWDNNPGTSLTAPADAEIFKIEKTDGTEGLLLKRTVGKSSNTYGYLSASNATSKGNDLQTETNIQNSTATSGRYSYFNFEKVEKGADGEFTMKKLGTTARYVKYNNNTGSNQRFAAYTSTASTSTNDMFSNILVYRKATGGSDDPTVEAPVISLSQRANTTEAVTVTIDCATEGATVTYTVKKDGNTVADNLTYDPANKPVFSEVGSYTVNATASKEGMNPANATPANFTIEKLVEVVEELFFVMDQNLWDVDGAYPETVVPFVYDRENGWYDLDIASIPATGWRQTAEGWFEINGGFRGNFYVRDGKANRKGLVFGAAGTVANTTYATRAAADGNQLVEPGVEYNMYIAGEGDTHKVFTTIGDDTNSKAFSAGTIRVTHTPGNKDAAKPMTLQILANSDQTTGVDSITAEDAASDADARFFNLQGVEVPADRLAPGIYIRQAGSKATKVLVK